MSKRSGYMLLTAALYAASGLALADGTAAGQGSINVKDSAFLQQAAQHDAAIAQLSQLAVDKSSDPKVKQLAQQLLQEQKNSDGQLKTLAQAKQVTLPSDPGADVQKQEKTLQGKSGNAFDEAWSKAIVSDHQVAVKAFTQESKSGEDAQIKKFAQGTLPGINAQLKSAQTIAAVPTARDDAMSSAMKASVSSPMSAIPNGMPGPSANGTPAEDAAAADLKH